MSGFYIAETAAFNFKTVDVDLDGRSEAEKTIEVKQKTQQFWHLQHSSEKKNFEGLGSLLIFFLYNCVDGDFEGNKQGGRVEKRDASGQLALFAVLGLSQKRHTKVTR